MNENSRIGERVGGVNRGRRLVFCEWQDERRTFNAQHPTSNKSVRLRKSQVVIVADWPPSILRRARQTPKAFARRLGSPRPRGAVGLFAIGRTRRGENSNPPFPLLPSVKICV